MSGAPPSATEHPRPRITEAQWQRQVIELARLYGWRVAHFRPARTEKGWRTPVEADGAGFPDLVLVRNDGETGELLFVELKADRGRESEAQRTWLNDLLAVADTVRPFLDGIVDAYCWRPRDFDEVHDRLRRRS